MGFDLVSNVYRSSVAEVCVHLIASRGDASINGLKGISWITHHWRVEGSRLKRPIYGKEKINRRLLAKWTWDWNLNSNYLQCLMWVLRQTVYIYTYGSRSSNHSKRKGVGADKWMGAMWWEQGQIITYALSLFFLSFSFFLILSLPSLSSYLRILPLYNFILLPNRLLGWRTCVVEFFLIPTIIKEAN